MKSTRTVEVTDWSCDCCGAKMDLVGHRIPDGWYARRHHPQSGSYESHTGFALCPRCVKDIKEGNYGDKD